MGRERLQDRSGVGAQRPVIEGEDHLAVGEEAGVLVLKAEARAGARINLEGAPDAKRLRTVRFAVRPTPVCRPSGTAATQTRKKRAFCLNPTLGPP